MDPSTKLLSATAPVRTDGLDPAALLAYFQNIWDLNERLFAAIEKEGARFVNPDPLRHPLIFYHGHTAAFYINKLVMAGLLDESDRIDPALERLFAQGVDPARAEELGAEAWPTEQATQAYRDQAYRLLVDFIQALAPGTVVHPAHPLWSLYMGLEHDRIHFETSSVLIRQYPADWLRRPEGWTYAPSDVPAPENAWLAVPAAEVKLGKPDDFPTFGWDDEYGHRAVSVPAFEATQNLITNAEFMAFLEAGGYENPAYWTEDGWAWRSQFEVAHPKFWVKTPDGFRYRAMFDELDMPAAWPVEVNWYEAAAYCRWYGQGARLLSEAEFQALAQWALHTPFDLPFADHYNLNVKFGSPTPVGMLPEAGSTLGFNDIWGNVWCWLSDDFYSLDGYRPHPYYLDFSEPYMDADHAMLLGGSWATTGTGASRYYRLWFRRHFYQHAGFRMARNLPA
ncbi:MAG: 5-histidylcysteine sulfoxide synthase [Bacteroidetes bacterium]|nr:MAG: 5-histidylcysteine sulfoxide synthase [Bacteroidota bacterium]